MTSLDEINAFAVMEQLDHLHISEEGNPLAKLSLWKPYVIYRLSHLKLKTLNKKQVYI